MARHSVMLLIRNAAVLLLAALAVLLVAFMAIGGWQFARLAIGPKLPHSAALTQGTDAEYFRDVVLDNERSGSAAQRQAFDTFARELAARRPPLDDEALSLEAARGLALFDNAHTHVSDGRLNRVPLRFHWFADGLYVVKAREEHESLLGARVVSIEGVDPEQLLRQLRAYIPGVEGWRRYRSEYLLSAPATLRAIGVSTDPGAIEFEFKRRDEVSIRLALLADATLLPSDSFREFRHVLPKDTSFGTEGWLRLADRVDPKPLYLREMPSPYARTWLEDEHAEYVRLDSSNDTHEIDLAEFLEQALENIAQHHAKHAIVDLRFCWGGNFMLTRKFSSDLAKALPRDGKVFIITGPNTFSAGLILAARLKHFAGDRAVIVGEPAGDRLQFWAEGFEVTLPRSQVELYLSTAAHDWKEGCKLFDRDCFVLNKFVDVAAGDLTPSVPARNTFADFMAGRDRAMDRIREIIDRT